MYMIHDGVYCLGLIVYRCRRYIDRILQLHHLASTEPATHASAHTQRRTDTNKPEAEAEAEAEADLH